MAHNSSWDPLERALEAFQRGDSEATLTVHHELGGPDPLPVSHFFRGESEMPDLEIRALDLCRGRVLDLGAGVGGHALELQRRGLEVVAADVLPAAVRIMEARGVLRPIRLNWETAELQPEWDTIILLMNGPGIAGTLEGLGRFLETVAQGLATGGQVLLDSTVLPEMEQAAERDEWGVPVDKDGRYPGELHYQLEFEGIRGEPFPHLFVDPGTLAHVARQAGLVTVEVLDRDEEGRYLARLAPSRA